MLFAKWNEQNDGYDVISADPESIEKRYYIDGSIFVDRESYEEKGQRYHFGNYEHEGPDCDFEGYKHNFQDYILVDEDKVPYWLVEMIEDYDCLIEDIPGEHLKDFSEEYKESITIEKIKEELDKIAEKDDHSWVLEEKYIPIWDQNIVVETDLDRDDVWEDVTDDEEFTDLEEIERSDFSTGAYILKKNENATWLAVYSRYQSHIATEYYFVPDETDNIDDAVKYFREKNKPLI